MQDLKLSHVLSGIQKEYIIYTALDPTVNDGVEERLYKQRYITAAIIKNNPSEIKPYTDNRLAYDDHLTILCNRGQGYKLTNGDFIRYNNQDYKIVSKKQREHTDFIVCIAQIYYQPILKIGP